MTEKKDTQAPKYPLDELLANCEAIFGVKPEVVIGALHGENNAEYAIDDVKNKVNEFLKKKVIN